MKQLVLIIILATAITFTGCKKSKTEPQEIAPAAPVTLVNKAPTLSGFSVSSRIVGDPQFILPVPSSDSKGTFTYSSSNITVAKIDGNIVTIVGPGTTTLTATQAASGDFNLGSITTTLSVALYYVGQQIPSGLVFYVDASGQHGLIAAEKNYTADIQWDNVSANITYAEGTGVGTGLSNTKKIITFLGANNYAASVCDKLVTGGVDDWYLPSKDELNLMYSNLYKKSIGNFTTGFYWTSSENQGIYAWIQVFGGELDGFQAPSNKGLFRKLRPIRAF